MAARRMASMTPRSKLERDHQQQAQRIRHLEERLVLLEAAVQGLLFERNLMIEEVISLEYGATH